MSKPVYNSNGELAYYEHGVIYDLGEYDPITNIRSPFYVGETLNMDGRADAHRREGKNATADSTDVYQHIKSLDQASIKWDAKELVKFGDEGSTDQEAEWIYKHLYDGYKLQNMKKGNSWAISAKVDLEEMRKLGISSRRVFAARKEREAEDIRNAKRDIKHAKWLVEQQKKKDKDTANLKLITDHLSKITLLSDFDNHGDEYDRFPGYTPELKAQLRAIVAGNQQRRTDAEVIMQQVRARVMATAMARADEVMAASVIRRAQQIEDDKVRAAQKTAIKSIADAKWTAGAPARAERIRIETERLQKENEILDANRQVANAKWQVEEAKRIAAKHTADIAQIRINRIAVVAQGRQRIAAQQMEFNASAWHINHLLTSPTESTPATRIANQNTLSELELRMKATLQSKFTPHQLANDMWKYTLKEIYG